MRKRLRHTVMPLLAGAVLLACGSRAGDDAIGQAADAATGGEAAAGGQAADAATGGEAAAGGAPVGDAALADTLRALITEAYDFSRAGVVERMTALYSDSGRVVSASGGHVMASLDSLRAGIESFWGEVGRNMREPRWEWGPLHVDRLGTDAAVLTAAWAIPHIAPDGAPHVISGAWTAVFRRVAGDWKIVHEHLSVPAEAAH